MAFSLGSASAPSTPRALARDLHRGWVTTLGALKGENDQVILSECERGEDIALRDYRLALEQDLPTEVREVVERQLNGVQRNHDQIKALRDQQITPEAAGLRGGARDFGQREGMQPAGMSATQHAVQWSLGQARLHPVRSIAVVAMLGTLGRRMLARRSGAVASWRRRFR